MSVVLTQTETPALNPITAGYGTQLALWMNASKGNADHKRLCVLVELFATIRKSISGYNFRTSVLQDGRGFSGRMPKEVSGQSKNPDYERHVARLNRKLREYTSFPRVHYPLDRQWVVGWLPAGKRAGPDKGLSEHDAVRLLQEIAADGELERLRQCECGCSGWLFARYPRQRYLKNHRQKVTQMSDRQQAKRRKYMREYMQKRRQEEA